MRPGQPAGPKPGKTQREKEKEKKAMKDTTKEMLNKIDTAHDWKEGQIYGGSGTQMSSTDICRVCSLRRHYSSDTQNGNHGEYRFSDGETGEDLSLRQALTRRCAE